EAVPQFAGPVDDLADGLDRGRAGRGVDGSIVQSNDHTWGELRDDVVHVYMKDGVVELDMTLCHLEPGDLRVGQHPYPIVEERGVQAARLHPGGELNAPLGVG